MNQKRNIRAHECKTVKYGAILNVRFDKASYIFIHLILILALIYIYITRFPFFLFFSFFLQYLIYLINIDKNINLDEQWNFYLAVRDRISKFKKKKKRRNLNLNSNQTSRSVSPSLSRA